MSSRYDRTSQQLAMLRRQSPLDRDARDTKVLEVIDVFYFSDDTTLIIGKIDATDFIGRPNLEDSRTRSSLDIPPTFDDPTISQLIASNDPVLNGGFYKHRLYPILRPDAEQGGALKFIFGYPLIGDLQEAREVLTIETTRLVLKNAGDNTQALVSIRLNAVGPGGVGGVTAPYNTHHHHLIAHATFREPVAGPPPNTNRAVVFNVEKATGFWARATNVTVIYFDDPTHPNYLAREISVLRGISPS